MEVAGAALERRRDGRHRLRPLARPGGRPAPPARRGGHVPAKRAQSRREFFSLDIEDEAPRRLILVTALKRAIDARAITMHYQPKVASRTGA